MATVVSEIIDLVTENTGKEVILIQDEDTVREHIDDYAILTLFHDQNPIVENDGLNTNGGTNDMPMLGKRVKDRSTTMKNIYAKKRKTLGGEKPFKCKECGLVFSQISDVLDHQNIHTGAKQHKCDICGRLFALQSTLKNHQVIHSTKHSTKDSTKHFHTCKICKNPFSLPCDLLAHMRSHNLKDEIHESKLGKCCCGESTLMKRQRCHIHDSHKKSYTCIECGKHFSQVHNLAKHSRTHKQSFGWNRYLQPPTTRSLPLL